MHDSLSENSMSDTMRTPFNEAKRRLVSALARVMVQAFDDHKLVPCTSQPTRSGGLRYIFAACPAMIVSVGMNTACDRTSSRAVQSQHNPVRLLFVLAAIMVALAIQDLQ
jgi:hypothetical protein